MNRFAKLALAAAFTAALVPAVAQAHRQWILPSATVLSGNNPWVTFDAAVSSEVFYFDAAPLRLADAGPPPQGMPNMPGAALRITAPDGTDAKAENAAAGRLRTVFDLHVTQNGTYKIAAVNEGVFASYKDNGQTKRWRGAAEDLAKAVPADAVDLQVTQTFARVETFVTLGKPTDTVFKAAGTGLELIPVTHPNNLFAGETASFKVLLDGKPATDVEVEIVPGGNRYRFKLGDVVTHTDAEGLFTATWPTAGMYWVGMSVEDGKSAIKGAKRRASYAATFEVLQ